MWVGAGEARVAEVDGQAECLVLTAPGSIRYLNGQLSFCGVTGVGTSRVVRRQGLATRVTAQAIAERALAGDKVAGLGMFEQGFYNRLGMGTGGYEHRIAFDPARLNVAGRPRSPPPVGGRCGGNACSAAGALHEPWRCVDDASGAHPR